MSEGILRRTRMATTSQLRLKHRSKEITEGPDRAPARAMLRAMGLTSDDMDKPFIAIANLASDVTPCNVHLDRLADAAKEGVRHCHRKRRHLHGD